MELDELYPDEIRKDIIRFNNDITTQRLREYYNRKSYMEIFGINRWELGHSSFISWFLDVTGEHGLLDFGIKRFLELLVFKENFKSHRIDKETIDIIIAGNYNINNFHIQKEKRLDNKNRVDILIEFELITNLKKNIRIIIENKVESKENKDQTDRYYSVYKDNTDAINIFVFLTPLEIEPKCDKFIQIDYQDLLSNILEPSLYRIKNSTYENIIKDYIQSLSQPVLINGEYNKKGIIMAIGKEERELLRQFWDINKSLIMAAAKAKREDDPDNDDVLLTNITSKKRPKLNYMEIGLKKGDKIVYLKDNNKEAIIISSNKVKYNDKEYALSNLTKELLNNDYYIKPSPFWLYKGKTLEELYNKKYPL
jgi:hypothetical protein